MNEIQERINSNGCFDEILPIIQQLGEVVDDADLTERTLAGAGAAPRLEVRGRRRLGQDLVGAQRDGNDAGATGGRTGAERS